ncbi:hypothetical protein HPB51_020814 [Rhipicephalus microplus]|uniref:BHLH domain-containing protein n=1 Tax=Rhipicephalus microplus TaxID=6941 RepID=A0A9J6DQD0_RHIMP|nr:protein max-like [Rhipicephalus microplus]KAH8024056.1 hypothetical protein HPB51_020814 [Rhipicephalus microplus]
MNEEEGEQDIEAERRAHHSALERRRRDHIKYTFGCLRDAVPSLQWERATRAQILKRATDYIQVMRRRNRERMHTIRDLRREKHHLEDQIRALENAERLSGGGRCSPSSSVVSTSVVADSVSPASSSPVLRR